MWLWGAGLLVLLAQQGYCQMALFSSNCPNSSAPKYDSTKKVFSNIDYLGKGYNILKGNPRFTDGGIDPGFGLRVFDLMNRFCGRLSTDLRYLIPENVDVDNTESCTLTFGSTYSNSSKSYLDDLKRDIKFGASGSYGPVKAAFMASDEYRSVSNGMATTNGVTIDSRAMCTLYKATLLQKDAPTVHYNFRLAVEDLPTTFDEESYDEEFISFFDYFGTHVISSMIMGATYGERFTLKDIGKSSQTELQDGAELAASSSVCYLGACAKASVGLSRAEINKRMETFSQKIENRKTISIGSKPPVPSESTTNESSRAAAWASQAFDNPVPIKYLEFLPITEVLQSKYIPDFDTELLAKKRAALVKAYESYCTEYALPFGLVTSCEPPAIPTPGAPTTTPQPGPANVKLGVSSFCLVGSGGKSGLIDPGNDGESRMADPPQRHAFIDLNFKHRKLLHGDMVFISCNVNWLWENNSWLYYRPDRQRSNPKFHWQIIKCDGKLGQEIFFGDCIHIRNGNNLRFINNRPNKNRVELVDNSAKWRIVAC